MVMFRDDEPTFPYGNVFKSFFLKGSYCVYIFDRLQFL